MDHHHLEQIMDRWGWMALRAYVPTGFALIVGLVSAWAVSGLPADSVIAGMLAPLQWVSPIAFLAAVGLSLLATYRLLQWERGNAITCDCGGLLGRERPGIKGRGDYRKCLACGRFVNHRHYD
ncbi:hypothetical protein [Lysobacter terrae]